MSEFPRSPHLSALPFLIRVHERKSAVSFCFFQFRSRYSFFTNCQSARRPQKPTFRLTPLATSQKPTAFPYNGASPTQSLPVRQSPRPQPQIGRASCRERVQISVVAVSL